MSELLFGLNTVLPIFLLILTGIFLKKVHLITEDFISMGTSLVYYCALPVRMFQDVAKSDFHTMTNVKFILFIVLATLAGFGMIWLLSILLCRDKSKRGAFVHSAFRGNYVYVGIPITQNILEMAMVPCTVLVITFVVPLYNILGVVVLSWYNQEGHKIDIRKLLLDILKNPLILAVLLGLPFSFFQWQLPEVVNGALKDLGSISTPLALLFIGASIRYKEFIRNLWLSMKAALLKVVLQPLLFVSLAIRLGFNTEEIVTIYVMLSVPTALNAYIVTKKLGGDEEASAGIVVATLLLSIVTIPVGIVLLKGAGVLA